MASLTGQTIQSTYDALLKISGNDALTSSLQRITDGLGNFTPLYLSTTAVEISSGLNVIGSITGSNLSGTNTGDETTSSIKTKLGAASSSQDGYLTSTDWSTFNSKGNGTVTSVGLSAPTGFSVSGSPVTSSGTLALSFASGYSLPTNTSQSNWDTAYTNRITSLTTTGSSGAATLISNTLNIPNYTLSGLGGVPTSRTITINGTAYDLSTDRSWSVGTVTSISGTGTVSGLTLTGTVTGSGSLTLGGTLSLTSGQITTGLGYTPVPNTRTLTINGTSYDLSADRSWTISTGISGSGTTNYLAKFTGSTSVGNSLVYDNGTNVGIGTTSPVAISNYTTLDVRGTNGSLLYMGLAGATAGLRLIGEGTDGYIDNLTTGGSLLFRTNNATERMRITSGGNVGIGTSSPSAKLDIQGNTSTTGTTIYKDGSTSIMLSGRDADFYGGSNSDGGIFVYGNNKLHLSTNSARRLTVDGSGNVGIGTTSPDIYSVGYSNRFLTSSASTGYSILTLAGAASNGGELDFGNPTIRHAAIASLDGSVLGFYTNGTNSGSGVTERMRITSSGNVGIGTTDASALISGTERVLKISSSGVASLYLESTSAARTWANYANTSGSLVWYDVTAGAARMSITSGGNVGIGTSSPGALLTVNGTPLATSGAIISIRDTSATGTGNYFGGIFFNSSPGTDFAIGKVSESGTSSLGFRNGNTGAEYMRITSGGNVGIGTSSPQGVFEAVGLSYFTRSGQSLLINANYGGANTHMQLQATGSMALAFATGGDNERMRIASDGAIQMRNVYNRQTASYTLVLGDAGKIVEMNVAGTNNNVTVPPNSSVAYPIGTEIFVTQYGSGQTSLVAGAGVTIRSDAGKLTIANQYKGACLLKVGTDEWYLIGSLK